jgi:hypothetical protein
MAATAAATRASFSNTCRYHCSKHPRIPSTFLGTVSLPKSTFYGYIAGFTAAQKSRHGYQFLLPRASAEDDNSGGDSESETVQVQQQQPSVSLSLDDVNPVGLGRKSRQLFDEVWRKFSGLGQISRTTRADDRDALDALLIREGPMCEFAVPGAQNTTVLVIGATSRIGRIVVRKLMLRGYTVKVFFICLLTFFSFISS